MDYRPLGSSVHGISKARILGWVAICFCGDLLDLGLETTSLEWEGRFFTTEPPGKPIFLFINSVQLQSCVRLFATPWTAVRQASLSITNFQTLLKLMSIESVRPSNHLILLSPSPPAFNLSRHQGLSKWVSSSHQVAKVFELQHQSFQWIFRTDLL